MLQTIKGKRIIQASSYIILKKKKIALNRLPCHHHQPRDRIPPCCFPPQRHSPALATPAEVTGETPTHQRQKPLLGTGTADRAVIRHRPNTLLTLSEFSYRVTERKGAGSVAENDISILSFLLSGLEGTNCHGVRGCEGRCCCEALREEARNFILGCGRIVLVGILTQSCDGFNAITISLPSPLLLTIYSLLSLFYYSCYHHHYHH